MNLKHFEMRTVGLRLYNKIYVCFFFLVFLFVSFLLLIIEAEELVQADLTPCPLFIECVPCGS